MDLKNPTHAMCGLLLPVIGIYFGLMISTMVGNLLAWPLILVSVMSGVPFGDFNGLLWLLSFSISIGFWIVVVQLVSKLHQ